MHTLKSVYTHKYLCIYNYITTLSVGNKSILEILVPISVYGMDFPTHA